MPGRFVLNNLEKLMKKIFLITIFALSANLFAGNDAYVISQQGTIELIPIGQSYTINDEKISEFSIPLHVYFPINRALSMSLYASQTNVSAKNYKDINGFGDPQISFNYYYEKAKALINLGLSLPFGKRELSTEEFETSSMLAQEQFDFHVPGFGQGLNIMPGLTWAYPFNDNFVIGLGASYQYKGPFKPLKEMENNYDPGDEILLTVGFDVRLIETMTLSTDIIYITYGEDKIAKETVFSSGNKLTGALILKKSFNYNELSMFARYRSKSKNSLAAGGVLIEEEKKTSPDNFNLLANFHWHNSSIFSTNFFLEMHSFEKTTAYDGLTAFGFGAGGQISLSKKLRIPLRFKYISGKYDDGKSLKGLEGMLGLDLSL